MRFVSNVTDIEDKIIARAAEEQQLYRGGGRPVRGPLVGDHGRPRRQAAGRRPPRDRLCGDMVDLIADLVLTGHAYEGGDGVYFATESVPGYGLLAHQDLGSPARRRPRRGAEEAGKRSPARLRPMEARQAGRACLAVALGAGRPGWHTECVVMSLDLLGEGFDLHLGGLDLVFPHHENERAQAVAAGKAFARRWAHNGMVVDERGEKMSKSVGNITSLPELLERYEGRVLRGLVLQAHYRSPMTVSAKALGSGQGAVEPARHLRPGDQGRAHRPVPDPATLARFRGAWTTTSTRPAPSRWSSGRYATARADPARAPALAAAVRECCEAALGLSLHGQEDALAPGRVRRRSLSGTQPGRGKDWAAADSIRDKLRPWASSSRTAPGHGRPARA